MGAIANLVAVALLSLPFLVAEDAVFSEQLALAAALVPTSFSAIVVILPLLLHAQRFLLHFPQHCNRLYGFAGLFTSVPPLCSLSCPFPSAASPSA